MDYKKTKCYLIVYILLIINRTISNIIISNNRYRIKQLTEYHQHNYRQVIEMHFLFFYHLDFKIG